MTGESVSSAAIMMAFSPEPQTLLIVRHGVEFLIPAIKAACLAGACPTPAVRTSPIIHSLTSSAETLDFFKASAIAIDPKRGAGTVENPPWKDPTGVLAKLVITTFSIKKPFIDLR